MVTWAVALAVAALQVLAAPPASTAYSMRGMAGPMYRQRHAEVPCLCRPWASCGFDSSSLESSLTHFLLTTSLPFGFPSGGYPSGPLRCSIAATITLTCDDEP
ncbi:hypothetical protein V8C40DRAFT_136054 [Trichoderma camerunense]